MTKEEFKTKKEIINSKMNELKNEMIKLEKEYIESNVKYPIGSKGYLLKPLALRSVIKQFCGVGMVPLILGNWTELK